MKQKELSFELLEIINKEGEKHYKIYVQENTKRDSTFLFFDTKTKYLVKKQIINKKTTKTPPTKTKGTRNNGTTEE